jgi:hypothetical protein
MKVLALGLMRAFLPCPHMAEDGRSNSLFYKDLSPIDEEKPS